MEASQLYIIITLLALVILGAVLFFTRKNKNRQKLTPLTGLAFGFIIVGIFIGDPQWLGYSFFGVAIVLAVIDIIIKKKPKKIKNKK